MKYAMLALVLLSVVAVGCMNESPVAIDTASPGPELIPQAPKTAPFQAHEENTIVCITENCAPGPDGFAHVEFPGVIEGDHIGSGTMFLASQVFFFVPPGDPFIQTAQGAITAANGDQLFVDMVGTGTADNTTGDIAFNGNFTFEGGTGRFATASGGGAYDGTANGIAGVGQFDLDGVISR